MKPLLYLIRKQMKNSVMRLFKKPLSIVGYILIIALMIFNIYNVLRGESAFSENSYSKIIFITIVLLMVYLSIFQPVFLGTKKFTMKFLVADGVYLMSSPVKSHHILWYAQIKQSVMYLLLSVLMLIQIPIIIEMVGLEMKVVPAFIIGFFMMSLVGSSLSLLSFTLGLKSEKNKQLIKIALIIIGLLGVFVIGLNLMNVESIEKDVIQGFTSIYWMAVPFVGWVFSLFIVTITGIYGMSFYISIVLCILTIGISIVYVTRLADDQYYEEALNTANMINKVQQQMKSGKTSFEALQGTKKRKVRKVKSSFKQKGVMAILDKQFLIRKKRGQNFINIKSMLIWVIIIGVMYLSTIVKDMENQGQLIALAAVSYILFFFQISSNMNEDLDRHYIYLFPYSAFKKLIALTSFDFIKMTIDAVIGFVVGSLITGYPLIEGVLCGLGIGLLSYLFTLNSIIALVLFGRISTLVIRLYLKMILSIIVVIPTLIVMIITFSSGIEYSMIYGLLFGFILLLITNCILIVPASLIVRKPEFNS